MTARSVISMLLAYVLPGAGHFYLGRRARGAAFFCIILFLFAIGLAVEGGVYTLAESRGALLRILAALGSMGSGALYLIARVLEVRSTVLSVTYEYGRMFTLSAGLMNLLLVLDCYDIAMGKKS